MNTPYYGQAQLYFNPGYQPYQAQPYQQPYFNDANLLTPSAPPEKPCNDLYPVSPPVLFVQPPYDYEASANKAYLNVHPELPALLQLPSINLNERSIQSLKQIEKNSKHGIISNVLNLMIKVLLVVGKLAMGFAVASSIALVLSALWSASAAGALIAAIVAVPLVGGLLLGHAACKISVYILSGLNQGWMNYSFHSAMKSEKEQLGPLKTWMEVKNPTEIEQRLRFAKQQIELAQQKVYIHPHRTDQINFLEQMLIKIDTFRNIEKQLDLKGSMPLLDRYLSKLTP